MSVSKENDRNDSDDGNHGTEENVTHAAGEADHHGEEDAEEVFCAALKTAEADKGESTENGDGSAEVAINHNHDGHHEQWQNCESDEKTFGSLRRLHVGNREGDTEN